MVFFDLSENSFLILAVLEKTRRAPTGVWTRIYHTEHVEVVLTAFLVVRPDNSPTRFIDIVFVTFMEDGFHGLSRKGDCNFGISRSEHRQYSSRCRRRIPLGVRV